MLYRATSTQPRAKEHAHCYFETILAKAKLDYCFNRVTFWCHVFCIFQIILSVNKSCKDSFSIEHSQFCGKCPRFRTAQVIAAQSGTAGMTEENGRKGLGRWWQNLEDVTQREGNLDRNISREGGKEQKKCCGVERVRTQKKRPEDKQGS